jgi:DNA-directed RNA polymerase specialized sigma24 family protein
MRHRPMPWTPKEEAILRQEALVGSSIAEIATKMGRYQSAVRARAYILRVVLRQPKSKLAAGPDRT